LPPLRPGVRARGGQPAARQREALLAAVGGCKGAGCCMHGTCCTVNWAALAGVGGLHGHKARACGAALPSQGTPLRALRQDGARNPQSRSRGIAACTSHTCTFSSSGAGALTPPPPTAHPARSYIYLWIKYAIFEELDAGDVARAREVYRAALKLVPHHVFTFSKVCCGHVRVCESVYVCVSVCACVRVYMCARMLAKAHAGVLRACACLWTPVCHKIGTQHQPNAECLHPHPNPRSCGC